MNKHVVEKYCISIRLFFDYFIYIYVCLKENELFYKSIKYNGVIGSILFSHLFVGWDWSFPYSNFLLLFSPVNFLD